jgi:hypothetical protein
MPLRESVTSTAPLLKKHASEFLEWLESSGKRFEYFDRLATALEVFLLNHVLVEGLEASAVSNDFAQALPGCAT